MKQKEDISDEFYDEKLRKLFALEPVISKKSKAFALEPVISKKSKAKMEMVYDIIRKHGMDLRRSSSKEIYK